MMNVRKVVVGVSGGVDSAVAAFLLKLKGYEVHGVFMKNWDVVEEDGSCSATADFKDAALVCKHIDIPLHQVSFVKQYWVHVFSQLLLDYQHGFTPNPDVLCNKHIKFDLFYEHAVNYFKADAIATGHYANTSFGSYLENYSPNCGVRLLKARDDFKDQTFFLHQISQRALRRTMFPLGGCLKDEVKQTAIDIGLAKIVNKKESTGICFIGQRNFKNFITEYIEKKPGNFIDIESGCVVGRHDGVHMWTLGQRCRIGGFPKAFFTCLKQVSTNTIYLVPGTDHSALFSQYFYFSEFYFINNKLSPGCYNFQFRFQHTKPLVKCNVFINSSGSGVVYLSNPLKAITPGQYAVFYDDDVCVGGAKIKSPGPSYFSLGFKVPPGYQEYMHHRSVLDKKVKLKM